jgi:autotransporter-associated beta strand protein
MTRSFLVSSLGLAALLTICNLAGSSAQTVTYYWDTIGQSGTITGGSGTWSTAAASWSTTSSGDAGLSAWPSNTSGYSAEFTANSVSSGAVNVSGNVNVDNITFDSGTGYTLSGGTITLSSGNGNITANANATIGSVVAGGAITELGSATITITNSANTFSGGVFLNSTNGGELGFASGALNGQTINFNGGALQWATGNTQDISSLINITSSSNMTANLDTNGNTVTLNTALSGTSAGLNKLGAGTLILNNSANYAGATTITAGTLQLNSATFASQTVSNSGAIAFNLPYNVPLTYAGAISGSGGLTFMTGSGTGNLTLTGSNTYSGLTIVGDSRTLVLNNPAGQAIQGNVQLGTGAPGNNDVVVSMSAANQFGPNSVISEAGSAFNSFNLNGYNQTIAGLSDSSAHCEVQNNTASGSSTLTINLNGGNYSFNGYLRDVGSHLGLTVGGTGTQTISGGLTSYSGPTTVNGGMLTLVNATGFASPSVNITGGTLNIVNSTANFYPWLTTTVTDNSTLMVQQNFGTALPLYPVISGSGGLGVSGTGTVELVSNAAYTGPTTVGAGTLQIGNGGTTTFASTTIGDSGTVVFATHGVVTTYAGAISGSGGVTVGLSTAIPASVTLTGSNTYTGMTVIGENSILTLNSPLGQSIGSVQFGTNATGNNYMVLTTSAANQFGPNAAITQTGSAYNQFNLDGNNQTIAGLSDSSGHLGVYNASASSSAVLTINVNGGSYSFNGTLANGSGAKALGLTVGGNGSQTLSGGAVTYTGSTTVNGGLLAVVNANGFSSPTVTITGGTFAIVNNTANFYPYLTTSIADSSTLQVQQNYATAMPLDIPIGGTGNVGVSGTGTVQLQTNMTYTGSTSIGANTTLQVGNNGTTTFASQAVSNSGQLIFANGTQTYAGAISGSGGVTVAYGNLTLTGSNTYTGLTVIDENRNITLNGPLGQSIGSVQFGTNATGNGYMVLTTSAANQFGPNAAITQTGSAYNQFNLAGNNETIAGVSDSSGHLTVQNNSTSSSDVLTINLNGGNYSFNGTLKDSSASYPLGLTVGGNGTQTLSGGAIEYSGPTTVAGGMLVLVDAVNFNTNAPANATTVTISGGTLSVVDNTQVMRPWNIGSIIDNSMLAFTVNTAALQEIDSGISGSGALSVAAGTLRLDLATTYTGATSIGPAAPPYRLEIMAQAASPVPPSAIAGRLSLPSMRPRLTRARFPAPVACR